MDFDDDHEEQDEEIGMPVSASYGNLSAAAAAKMVISSGGGGSGDVGGGGSVLGRKSLVGQKYRECLKNHAVGIGGHAVDGCGEFMPAGEEGSLDALKCAACNCHRNFHRKETPEGVDGVYNHHHHHQFSQYYRAPAGYLQVAPHHKPPLALPSTSGGGGGGSGNDQDEDMSGPSGGGGMSGGGGGGGSSSKKRFRTKFTQEQKDKMLAFAEKLGWRIQKHDEAAVQQFCTETCVKRHVLKYMDVALDQMTRVR
ncbi:Zinc-finger homeodomain protein [Thalictrum thalictroides]|uniref:Zinc-finger homeodomain protein n=1 Tax=Thalictrum thalictroides TaxID=46969 RepID=A0A7J6XEL3_THATH|nr:Zinc-finger homeodomain protein [Thalictrum thalictroides]